MDGYVLNKFVTISKVGQRRFLVKHGMLSRASFVLDFEPTQQSRVELLDRIIATKSIDSESILQLQGDGGDANELLELLLDERVFVPSHSQDFEQYYALINERSIGNNPLRSSCFVASSPQIKLALTQGLAGVSLPFTIMSPEEFADSAEIPEIVVVVYDRFNSPDFHNFNRYALEHEIPLLISYLDGSTTVVSPIVIHGETVCYNELEIQLEASFTHRPEYQAFKALSRESVTYPPFLLNQLTFLTLHLLTDFQLTGKLKTKNRALIFDTESLRFDLVDVLPMPVCPACRLDHAMSHDYL